MVHMIRSMIFICLTTLCFDVGALTAQADETEQGVTTSFPHADVIEELLNFSIESSEECTLACFAEIQPHETTMPEIQELSSKLFDEDESILAQFDRPFEREDGLIDYTLIVNDDEEIEGFFDISFLVTQDEVLRRFQTHLFQPENWLNSTVLDISMILNSLGTPDEVYVAIAASQPPQFSIVLGYETLGIVFLYTYRFEPERLTQSDEPIPLCGSWERTHSINIWIQAVDEDFYEDLLEEYLRIDEAENTDEIVYRAFWPLEKMTKWNIEDLTQFLTDNPEWCFDALSYEKLLESGYSY